MKFGLCSLLGLWIAGTAMGGTISELIDPVTGWVVYSASQGETTIQIVPSAGCNVYSIEYQNQQLLRQPETVKQVAGFRYGVPILYPTPNRVRDSKMTVAGTTYNFEPNDGNNFLHGLVHSAPFKVTNITPQDDRVTIRCQLDFEPGTPWYEKFPHRHRLIVDVTVTNSGVRWTYTVENPDGPKAVPYGFGLHPWFLYQGSRRETFLTVPAIKLMESKAMLPTGRLLDLDGTRYDATRPISLEDFVVDDVYYGLMPEKPAVINFREAGFEIGLFATANFTHMVVYTPAQEPWFCVENQTCSTDAHNLYERGLKQESHLLMVETGSSNTGWVEYRFRSY
ncbi:MAG: aldose 1-epimerase [Planctomycetota bacterium]